MAGKKAERPVSAMAEQAAPARMRLSPDQKLCLWLIVLCCLLYANTLADGYAFDDPLFISKNTLVTQGLKGIPQLLVTPHMYGYSVLPNDMYRPLSMVMFATEHQFFGDSPLTGHLFNVLAFAWCVVMLFLFLRKLFGTDRIAPALIASLIFAFHPLHTEVVANIKSRDELLCYGFAFLSLNLFAKYMGEARPGALAGGTIALLLSFLSKETVISFVAVVPFIFFFYLRDDRRRAWLISAATWMVAAAFVGIRAYVLHRYNADQTVHLEFIDSSLSFAPTPFSSYATAIVILGKYLKLLLVPYPLLCDYAYCSFPFASITSISFWLSALCYLALIVVAMRRWMKHRNDLWAFSIGFFLLTLFLFSNLPFFIAGQLGERYLFFASTGFCIAAALAAEKWLMSGRVGMEALKARSLMYVLIPILVFYSVVTVARNAQWDSSDTLFAADVMHSPDDARLHHHYGTALRFKAEEATDSVTKLDLQRQALAQYRIALSIYPNYLDDMSDLSQLYYKLKSFDSAIIYINQILRICPKKDIAAVAANNIANISFAKGDYAQAIRYFELAATYMPNLKDCYFNIAQPFIKLGNHDSAIFYIYRCLEKDSSYSGEHAHIANEFAEMHQPDSAIAHYKTNIDLLHNNVDAINNLGLYYFNLSRYEEAIGEFRLVVAESPKFVNGYANLGISCFKAGKYKEAADAIKSELILEPGNGQDGVYLAAAYYKLGEKDSASKYEQMIRSAIPSFKASEVK
jgi:protein O-mannosyl-transferase